MDTFMDKLAQKLTAQEIIKANSQADAEELKELRGQIIEYNNCLAQMQKTSDELRTVNEQLGSIVNDRIVPELNRLVEDSVQKLGSVSVDTEELDMLVEEGSTRMKRITSMSTEQLQRIADESLEKLDALAMASASKLDGIVEQSTQKIEDIVDRSTQKLENAQIDTGEIETLVRESTDRIRQIADESLKKIKEIEVQREENKPDDMSALLSEKIQEANDHVHRECVKVYRNVQAVIVEESGRQQDNLNEGLKSVKSRLGKLTGISVLALIFSILGLVSQIVLHFI